MLYNYYEDDSTKLLLNVLIKINIVLVVILLIIYVVSLIFGFTVSLTLLNLQ